MAATPPFPEVNVYQIILLVIGALVATITLAVIYIRRLQREINQTNMALEMQNYNKGVGAIALSKRAEDVLKEVMMGPELQSDLPGILEVSKTTVSHAVSELNDRGLIKRKKRAQTYLIEPDMEAIREETRDELPPEE